MKRWKVKALQSRIVAGSLKLGRPRKRLSPTKGRSRLSPGLGRALGRRRQAGIPVITFSTFIFSLNTSALVHLGDYPDPSTGKSEEDLPLAKQTIDLIALLEEKSRGNLTKDEESLIKHILYDLRLRYVQKTR